MKKYNCPNWQHKGDYMTNFDPIQNYIYSKRNGGVRISLGGLNPTGASCEITQENGNKKLVGKCHRQVWYSKKRIPRTNETDDLSFVRFGIGDAYEEELQQHWQKQGILLASNLKIKAPIGVCSDGEQIDMSGEIDAILRMCEMDEYGRVVNMDMEQAVAIEVKSTRGYFSEKMLMGKGNKMYPIGYPKLEHLMQTGMYLHTRKLVEDTYGVKIPYAVLVYGLVDSCRTNQFRIELSNDYDGEILVKTMDGRLIQPNTDPMEQLKDPNGKTNQPIGGLTIENILARYVLSYEKLKEDTPPERDFSLRFSDELFEELKSKGELTKTKIAAFEKNATNPVGDWQCSYCDWADECYPFGVMTELVESGGITKEDAMRELGF
jgi:hypothetical protein|tara:strand:+ start:188 stop:1321 length:1134 start_codon:yes stop_codon:yes gene_type:complete